MNNCMIINFWIITIAVLTLMTYQILKTLVERDNRWGHGASCSNFTVLIEIVEVRCILLLHCVKIYYL